MQIDLTIDDLSHLLNALAPQVVRGAEPSVVDLCVRLNEAFYQLFQEEADAMAKTSMSPHMPDKPAPETKTSGAADEGDTASKTAMKMPTVHWSTSAHVPDKPAPETAMKGGK